MAGARGCFNCGGCAWRFRVVDAMEVWRIRLHLLRRLPSFLCVCGVVLTEFVVISSMYRKLIRIQTIKPRSIYAFDPFITCPLRSAGTSSVTLLSR
ncbi:hypothetical protein NEOLEDRAFT_1142213 [Neolentinus lepideus HHB14362 ss-1]|uniref:Uncharacterized protein n=1 Tax=Neolentinus lepideus HHB14362 ss-1 TaxID=1314782 RepID=A0A165N8K7_9AGAM|nr:hypothetical protein NEOLEDRAFT_1142213 [Neolentinus lepideus HHB14362 ss-1]